MAPFSSEDLSGDSFVITNARHYDLLVRAEDAIRSAEEHLQARASEELVLVGLYDALRFLGQITGETTPDDILGQIFLTFCIGK
jgi:tRNA modification GTPase